MIRILYRHMSGTIVHDLPIDQLAAAVRDTNASVWVDLTAPTAEEQRLILEEIFSFHPLAIEDAVNSLLVPKINDYRRYLFLVIHSIYPGVELVDLVSSELDIFLGSNFLVTIHDREMAAVEDLWDREDHHGEDGLSRGPAFLLYEILDLQVDRFSRLLDRFEAELERLGDVIFQRNSNRQEDLLDDLLTARSSALRLNRVLQPQRDLMHRIAQSDYSVIPSTVRPYYGDVQDHLVRLVGLVDSMQELARSTIDIYMALYDHRMNEIMKVLTVIATIFMPLSFLAGVYGMNFVYFPELQWPWAYPALWVVFIVITIGLLRYFRRIGWL